MRQVIANLMSTQVDAVGTAPTSKYDKARELGVTILSEGEFEELLGLK